MKLLKSFVTLTACFLILGLASETYADISNAALLYLRIAPGSRAAGMGEAYVAVADDATSTHWNPAGLGLPPLADRWEETKVPTSLRPLTSVTAVKARGGSNYEAYDVWALTPRGLARYDSKNWYLYEVFETKTDQTVNRIVSYYFNVGDEEQLAEIIEKVARDNNRMSFDSLTAFLDRMMAAVPENYSDRPALQEGCDSLKSAYLPCLLNWERLDEAQRFFSDGMKDSSLSENEIDRINFAVERSRNRFIPEELKIHYSSLFGSDITAISSTEQVLVIGTSQGLFSYNGKRWQTYNTENGLPSMRITTMASRNNSVYIGTDHGIVRFNGAILEPVGDTASFPEGEVEAIGASSGLDVYAVVNKQLYHYDGKSWVNGHKYTTVIDDTPEKIAARFSIYGTSGEQSKYLELLKELNHPSNKPAMPSVDTTDGPSISDMVRDENVVESDPVVESESVPAEVNSPDEAPSEAGTESMPPYPEDFKLDLRPGTDIYVPYLAELKGDVNEIFIDVQGRLWIGTSYGIVEFDGEKWVLPGYRDHVVTEGQTLDSVMAIERSRNPIDSAKYRQALTDINELTEETLAAGQSLKIYRNPTASAVNAINGTSNSVYFATTNGLIEYDGQSWNKSGMSSLSNDNVVRAEVSGKELWFAGDDEMIIKANGRTDISLMFAKWLPDLADDIYYAFMSAVTSKEGWGTFGGNITYITYGTVNRTDANGNPIGTFEPFDIAFTLSYGASITNSLKGGISAKIIYSQLSTLGAGEEKGNGTATGFGVDLGLIYQMSRRFNLGLAITNIGPDISYIDASQSDPLPRNLALGFAYKLLDAEYYHLLITAEGNKSVVEANDGFSREIKEVVWNGGGEFQYANIIAFRAGYIYDQEGDIKTITLGVGLAPLSQFKFDFAYIPSNTEAPLANTLRISLQILP